MFESERAADLYDLVYQARKDYPAEAEAVAQLIRSRRPDASSLLDVGCGTGIHLKTLAGFFDTIEGLELSESMLEMARRRLPGVALHRADMRSFQLESKFDAIICMFSAIAYLSTVDDLYQAVHSMFRHLSPGGVLVVEPWWSPEDFLDGYVSAQVVRDQHRTVARVSHSTREDEVTRIEIHYLIGSSDGVEYHSDVDRLRMYTRENYEDAFTKAGAKVEHVGAGLGYYVGTNPVS